jgi:hypothetical protein
MNRLNQDLAELLGVNMTCRTFDDGAQYTLTVARGEEPGYEGPFALTATWWWDEDEVAFNRGITRWLHDVPWPSEDDPRTQHEGVQS